MDNTIQTEPGKADYLRALAKMNPETLAILADLAKKPGIEKKLKDNLKVLKMFL